MSNGTIVPVEKNLSDSISKPDTASYHGSSILVMTNQIISYSFPAPELSTRPN